MHESEQPTIRSRAAKIFTDLCLRSTKQRDCRNAQELRGGCSPEDPRSHEGQPGGSPMGATATTPGIPALIPVIVHGFDSDGGTYTLKFTSYAVSSEIVDNHTVVTKFSNGVELTQRVLL